MLILLLSAQRVHQHFAPSPLTTNKHSSDPSLLVVLDCTLESMVRPVGFLYLECSIPAHAGPCSFRRSKLLQQLKLETSSPKTKQKRGHTYDGERGRGHGCHADSNGNDCCWIHIPFGMGMQQCGAAALQMHARHTTSSACLLKDVPTARVALGFC